MLVSCADGFISYTIVLQFWFLHVCSVCVQLILFVFSLNLSMFISLCFVPFTHQSFISSDSVQLCSSGVSTLPQSPPACILSASPSVLCGVGFSSCLLEFHVISFLIHQFLKFLVLFLTWVFCIFKCISYSNKAASFSLPFCLRVLQLGLALPVT